MTTPDTPALPDDLTYEQARDELLDVVNRLESGGESLAESMELFKRGEALAALCERYLTEARTTIEAAREA
ncbi:MAG: exodeoxyribonuclease VII small subunit [Propionibacteriaceae bacterium]|jgi:exodeoxyribonuclease VII small subunit|nr:exodeoxyribonuclease VII small subunit [Propionibacteriaceae bacterium]